MQVAIDLVRDKDTALTMHSVPADSKLWKIASKPTLLETDDGRKFYSADIEVGNIRFTIFRNQ